MDSFMKWGGVKRGKLLFWNKNEYGKIKETLLKGIVKRRKGVDTGKRREQHEMITL